MRTERLRPRPAPDLLLAACERLGVPPGAAATFTHNPAGVAAGHVGGLTVIAADSLAALLDRRILAAR
jgi:beta-phosphoglucomutase-like phosphatase (HAD superfamily)